jgi:hypothetical protein|tara:strand:- start:3964 stop:4101 length:138 start_codon:yes stop_codon:yes gene_type:complete
LIRQTITQKRPVLFAATAPFDIVKVGDGQNYDADKRNTDKASSPS